MIKIFFLLTSFFNTIISNFIVDIKELNFEIVKIENEVSLEVQDRQYLKRGDVNLISFSILEDISFISINDEIILSSKLDGIVTIYQLDKYGVVKNKKTLPNKYEEFFLEFNNNVIYAYGGIFSYEEEFLKYKKEYFSKTDCFIASVDNDLNLFNFNCFGGSLNEAFSNIKFYDNFILLSGYKEDLSGGDFGNGGKEVSGLFVILNYNFKIEKYLIFNELINSINYNNNFTIITKNYIYLFDIDLNLKNSQKFPSESIFSAFTTNNAIVVINDSEVIIYDGNTLKDIDHYQYTNPIEGAYSNNKYIVIKGEKLYKLNVFDLRDFLPNQIHNYLIPGSIYTIYDKLNLDKIIYKDYFDPLVSGVYDVEYDFKEVKLPGTYHVLEEENVSNDMIYPIGYRLLFSGTGYLNNKLINNNYSLNYPGNYKLELISVDKSSREINFRVDGDQINFTESLNKTYDKSVLINEYLEIDLELQSLSETKILKIISNYDTSFSYANNILKIKVIYDEPGLKLLYIDHLIYQIGEDEFIYNIKKTYLINVVNDEFIISTLFSNLNKPVFNIKIIDNLIQLRGINIRVLSNKSEYNYFYPLCDFDIELDNLETDIVYKVYIDIIYTVDHKSLLSSNLFMLEVSGKSSYDIATIDITSKGQSIEEANIYLNEKTYKLYEANKLIYEDSYQSIIKGVITSIGIGFIICGIIIVIKNKWLGK